jgi:hypothetical protein
MVRIGGTGAFACAVAIAVAGCTASATPAPSASSSAQPSVASASTQSAPASAPQASAPTPAPTVSQQAPSGGLPRSWTRSADLLAIDGSPYVIAAPGGGFLAVVSDARRVLIALQSPDGQTWSQISDPVGTTCVPTAVCGVTPTGLAAGGQTLVMIGRDESMAVAGIWTSPDGKAWTRIRTVPDLHRGDLSGLVATPVGFAAVVNSPFGSPPDVGVVIGSADGRSWTVSWLHTQGTAAAGSMLDAVAATDAGYAALGTTAMGLTVWRSRDGQTWTAKALPGGKDIGFGGSLVVQDREIWAFKAEDIWQSDTANAHRWVSTDGGVSWADGGQGPRFNLLTATISLPTGLVAVGSPATSGQAGGGPIWTSPDGTAWTAGSMGGAESRTNDVAESIAESNGRVVVGGWTDIDKSTATGDEAQAQGRLVFWVGDALTPPALAPLPSPQPPEPTATPSSSPGTAEASQWPMPHQDPGVEALLPTTVGGKPYAVGSLLMPIEQDQPGGDMCIYFCPGEIGGWARKLGIASGLVSFGVAAPKGATGDQATAIFALQPPAPSGGAPILDVKLEDAWVATHATDGVGGRQDLTLTLGGKRVRLVMIPAGSYLNRYIYAHGGTLYVVVIQIPGGLEDPRHPGPFADAVFAALP